MNDFHGRIDGLHVRVGQCAPSAADRVEHRPAERGRQALLQDGVDPTLGFRCPLGEHRLHRQSAERQTDPTIADVIVQRFGDFEAAAAHVADSPDWTKEAADHPQRGEPRLFRPAQDTDLEAGLGPDGRRERRPVGSAADRFGPRDVEFGDPHRIRDGAEAAKRLDGPAKAVRIDGAGLGQAFAEAAERFLVETRQRRATELVIDHQPHRIRPDIDDRVGRPAGASRALGIKLQRSRNNPRRLRFL